MSACLAHGLVGVGQIGKGMWAEPDDMRAMLEAKGAQLAAGGSTGWVPSPVASSLHALHYMRTSVPATQAALTASLGLRATGERAGRSMSRAHRIPPHVSAPARVHVGGGSSTFRGAAASSATPQKPAPCCSPPRPTKALWSRAR